MSRNTHPKVQAGVWLKPNQADALETAVYRCRPDSLQERDDTILTLMFDTHAHVRHRAPPRGQLGIVSPWTPAERLSDG